MSTPYIGEITMFGGNFAPRGWALCDGQLLQIAQFNALFALLGTTYGGDGRTTFALPDLRGRVPFNFGQGPGLSNHNIGQKSGTEQVTLNANQFPSHTHSLRASGTAADSDDPSGKVLAVSQNYATGNTVEMSNQAITNTGNNSFSSHSNMGPSLCVNFIIALEGVFPSRN